MIASELNDSGDTAPTGRSCANLVVPSLRATGQDFVAIDGKTSRRSHDRGQGKAALHLVSAYATTARLVLGQEAVSDKSNETTAIPVILERLGRNEGLKGSIVSIDAIATNATIAKAITDQGADYLLAVKASQPTLRREMELYFREATAEAFRTTVDLDKGHGRIEERQVTVSSETDWLNGARRFPGDLRLPRARTLIRVRSRTELKDPCRFDTPYFTTSATCDAETAAKAVRSHWLIENALHWTLDIVFKDDQSRLRKGLGTKHGHRQTLRHQSRPRHQGQEIHQAASKTSRME